MDKEWIAFIGVVVGAGIAGVIGFLNSYFQHKRESKEKRRLERIRLLEEIISGSDSASNSLSYLYSNISVALLAKTPDTIKSLKIPDFPLSRLELIIRMHFESLVPHFEKMIAGRDRCSDNFIQSCKVYASDDTSVWAKSVMSLMNEVKAFSDQCDALKKAAIALGRKEIG